MLGTRSWFALHRQLALLLLAALFIIAHGCHRGDHDDELSVILQSWEPPQQQQE